uniref:Uncharacterized protein n=1 Tax=Entamoeba invadens TaxID=33085 RepID=S0B1F0_ENTIV|nr:hypothetical protein [Entamoeba invadens]
MVSLFLLFASAFSQTQTQKFGPQGMQPTGIHPTTEEAMRYRELLEKQDADQIKSHLQNRAQTIGENFDRQFKNRNELEMHRLRMGNYKEKDNYRRKLIQFIRNDPYQTHVKELTDHEKEDLENFRKFMKAADKPFSLNQFYAMTKRKENTDMYGNVGLKMNGCDGVFNGQPGWYEKRIEWLSKVGPGLDEPKKGYLNDKFFIYNDDKPQSFIGKNAPVVFAH